MEKFDEKLYLEDMYKDGYFPDFLVDKVKLLLIEVVEYLQEEKRSIDEIQAKFDYITEKINRLDKEFYKNDSEIETVARESICHTIEYILKHFNVDMDCETAVRRRQW